MSLKSEVKSFFYELIKYARIKKKITFVILMISVIFIGILILLARGRNPHNYMGNLKNDGLIVYNKNTLFCQSFNYGNVDGIYKIKKERNN